MSEKTVTPDYRRIEKLIAAYHYELAPRRGCGPFETVPELIQEAIEAINKWDSDEDLPSDVCDRMAEQMTTLGEYVLRGMIAAGLIEQAEAFVGDVALSRAECDAKFKTGAIPFTEEEREQLAMAWDARSAGMDARREREGKAVAS